MNIPIERRAIPVPFIALDHTIAVAVHVLEAIASVVVPRGNASVAAIAPGAARHRVRVAQPAVAIADQSDRAVCSTAERPTLHPVRHQVVVAGDHHVSAFILIFAPQAGEMMARRSIECGEGASRYSLQRLAPHDRLWRYSCEHRVFGPQR